MLKYDWCIDYTISYKIHSYSSCALSLSFVMYYAKLLNARGLLSLLWFYTGKRLILQ